jgi:hypothetical protein
MKVVNIPSSCLFFSLLPQVVDACGEFEPNCGHFSWIARAQGFGVGGV